MSEFIRDVYEYRNLLGRRDLLRMRLDDLELARLAHLAHNLEWSTKDFGPAVFPGALRRSHARAEVRVPAMVKTPADFEPVTLVNMGGGGLAVEPAPSLRLGDLTVVRILDAESGREIHFPARVEWMEERLLGSMLGLSFFGIPIELRFGGARASRAVAA